MLRSCFIGDSLLVTLPGNFPVLTNVSLECMDCQPMSLVEVQANKSNSELHYRVRLTVDYQIASTLAGDTVHSKPMKTALSALNYHLSRNGAASQLLLLPQKPSIEWVPPKDKSQASEDRVLRLVLPPYCGWYVRSDTPYFMGLLGFQDYQTVDRTDPRGNVKYTYMGYVNDTKDTIYIYGTRNMSLVFTLQNDLLMNAPYEAVHFLHTLECVIVTGLLRVPYTLGETIFDESYFSIIMTQINTMMQDLGFCSPHIQWRTDGLIRKVLECVITDKVWLMYMTKGQLKVTFEPLSYHFKEISNISNIGGKFRTFFRLFRAQLNDKPYQGKITSFRLVMRDCTFPANYYGSDGVQYTVLYDKHESSIRRYTVRTSVSLGPHRGFVVTLLTRQNAMIHPNPCLALQLKITGQPATPHYPHIPADAAAAAVALWS